MQRAVTLFVLAWFMTWPAVADDNADANRLVVQAVRLIEGAKNEADRQKRLATLKEVDLLLARIVDRYPGSNAAVTIATGQSIGTLDRKAVVKEIDALSAAACLERPTRSCLIERARDSMRALRALQRPVDASLLAVLQALNDDVAGALATLKEFDLLGSQDSWDNSLWYLAFIVGEQNIQAAEQIASFIKGEEKKTKAQFDLVACLALHGRLDEAMTRASALDRSSSGANGRSGALSAIAHGLIRRKDYAGALQIEARLNHEGVTYEIAMAMMKARQIATAVKLSERIKDQGWLLLLIEEVVVVGEGGAAKQIINRISDPNLRRELLILADLSEARDLPATFRQLDDLPVTRSRVDLLRRLAATRREMLILDRAISDAAKLKDPKHSGSDVNRMVGDFHKEVYQPGNISHLRRMVDQYIRSDSEKAGLYLRLWRELGSDPALLEEASKLALSSRDSYLLFSTAVEFAKRGANDATMRHLAQVSDSDFMSPVEGYRDPTPLPVLSWIAKTAETEKDALTKTHLFLFALQTTPPDR